jgi:hypothetical protein
MVSSSKLLVSNGIFHFQHDRLSIHNSCVPQADIELIGWLPQALDMDPSESIWIKVKITIQDSWNVLLLKNRMLGMKLLCPSTVFVP